MSCPIKFEKTITSEDGVRTRCLFTKDLGAGDIINMNILEVTIPDRTWNPEDFAKLCEHGSKDFADVTDATAWVEELRGHGEENEDIEIKTNKYESKI